MKNCLYQICYIQQMLKITACKNIIFNSCLKSNSFSYAIIVAY